MPKITIIKEPSEISKINELIHDQWFARDAVQYEPEHAWLQIRFARESKEACKIINKFLFIEKVQIPYFECILSVLHVSRCSVNYLSSDVEFDFNELRFIPEKGLITITSDLPVKIDISVNEFHISVEQTNAILYERTSYRFGWGHSKLEGNP